MTTSDDKPSRRVVEQRIRNRVIEYLELAASFEHQLEYQERVPIARVPSEVINQWEDWAGEDPLEGRDRHSVSAYSPDELAAMRAFHAVWDRAADALQYERSWDVAFAQTLPEWDDMRRAAAAALEVFAVRGRMPEDHEVA